MRDIFMGPEKNRPTVETMLAGLRNKYGPESYRDKGNQIVWIWDAAGQSVQTPAVAVPRERCRRRRVSDPPRAGK